MDPVDLLPQYFHRTVRWDWSGPNLIHVVDDRSPRVITLDPWSQRIFLVATGKLTVKHLLREAAGWYPSGQVPADLDARILEDVRTLVSEGLLVLSTRPVQLPPELLAPISPEGEVRIIGRWTGTYAYDRPGMPAVDFELVVERADSKWFHGGVRDVGAEGTPGQGIVTGTWGRHEVQFTKQMPVAQWLDEVGVRHVDAKRPHRPLHYKGIFSHDKRILQGTWMFKPDWAWRGLLPGRVTYGTGTFTMKREA